MNQKSFALIFAAFLIGLGTMYAAQRWTASPAHEPFTESALDRLFGDEFFRQSRDPFSEMDRFQRELDKHFERRNSLFDGWFEKQFGDWPASKITMNEDTGYLYYRLDTGGQAVTDTSLEVAEEAISFNATLTSTSAGSRSSRSISQRFPLPGGVDPNSALLTVEDDEIVIRLTKRKQ